MKVTKKPAKIAHLVNWYFGNFCVRCGRIDLPEEDYGGYCIEKLHKLGDAIGVGEITHREFVRLVKEGTTFCNPTKRQFRECSICNAIGGPCAKK